MLHNYVSFARVISGWSIPDWIAYVGVDTIINCKNHYTG